MTGHVWEHFQFGLLVTGEGEERGICGMFRSLAATGLCSFRVLRRIEQLRPVTSTSRQLRMSGSGKKIPTKDEERISLPARRHLAGGKGNFVILIDDLERADDVEARTIFNRYRDTLGAALTPEQRTRNAVHFFAAMMEAYFFADTKTTNAALNLQLEDHDGDVEQIGNPKATLKGLFPSYNEVKHGAGILGNLDIPHVLSHADRCGYLRSLFAWCVKHVSSHVGWITVAQPIYRIEDGVQAEVTRGQ